MQKTTTLMTKLEVTEDHTAQIESGVEAIEKDLEELLDDLEISKTVNASLHRLDSSLTTTTQLLTVVSIIPQISTAASRLRTVITRFHPPIKKAVKESDAVEKIIRPIRDKIAKIEPRVEQADNALLEVMQTESQLLGALGGAYQCISTLPESTVRTTLEEQLETASGAMQPVVVKFDQAQVQFLKDVRTATRNVDKISSWARGLVNLNAEINRVLDTLQPLISTMRQISSALKKTIRVPYGGWPKMCKKWGIPYPCGWHTTYFSFTVQQILDGVEGVVGPVMDLLNKAVDAVLNPLLKALNLNLKLPEIPGLKVLTELKQKLKATYDSFDKGLQKLLGRMAVFKQFRNKLLKVLDEIEKIGSGCLRENPLVA